MNVAGLLPAISILAKQKLDRLFGPAYARHMHALHLSCLCGHRATVTGKNIIDRAKTATFRCTACGSSENVSYVLGWVNDANALEGTRQT